MEIKDLPKTKALLDDVQDFINNPNFHPKNQNKWFFSDGLSYYQQLCEILKLLEYFQQAFAIVQENENSLNESVNELLPLTQEVEEMQKEIDDFKEEFKDVPTEIETLQNEVSTLTISVEEEKTKIENLENVTSEHTTQLQSLATNLVDETKARESGDTTLQTNIDNETNARKLADEEILSQIGTLKGTVVPDGTKLDDMKETGYYCVNGDWGATTPTTEEYTYTFDGHYSTLMVIYINDPSFEYPSITQVLFDRKIETLTPEYKYKYMSGLIFNRSYDYTTDKWLDWQSMLSVQEFYIMWQQIEIAFNTIKENYLQSVAFNNNDNIEFTQVSKTDGVQTYNVTVKGSTPANLSQNLALINDNNYSVLSSVDTDVKVLKRSGYTSPYINGKIAYDGFYMDTSYILGKFNSNDFTFDSDSIMSFNDTISPKITSETSARKTADNEIISNLNSEIENRKNADETITSNLNKLLSGVVVEDGTSIDEIVNNGFYHQSGDWSGTLPELTGHEWHYSNLLAFNCGVDVTVQMLFEYNTNCFCVRTGRSNPITWTKWSIYNTSTEELGSNFTTELKKTNDNVSNLNISLSNETSERKSSDSTLQTNINNLTTSLDNEVSERKNSDSTLNSEIELKADKTSLGDQVTFSLSGTILTITSK